MNIDIALVANTLLFALLAVATAYLGGSAGHVRYSVYSGVCALLSIVSLYFIGSLL